MTKHTHIHHNRHKRHKGPVTIIMICLIKISLWGCNRIHTGMKLNKFPQMGYNSSNNNEIEMQTLGTENDRICQELVDENAILDNMVAILDALDLMHTNVGIVPQDAYKIGINVAKKGFYSIVFASATALFFLIPYLQITDCHNFFGGLPISPIEQSALRNISTSYMWKLYQTRDILSNYTDSEERRFVEETILHSRMIQRKDKYHTYVTDTQQMQKWLAAAYTIMVLGGKFLLNGWVEQPKEVLAHQAKELVWLKNQASASLKEAEARSSNTEWVSKAQKNLEALYIALMHYLVSRTQGKEKNRKEFLERIKPNLNSLIHKIKRVTWITIDSAHYKHLL